MGRMILAAAALIGALATPVASEARGRRGGSVVHVRGHTTKTGRYVAPHVRTAPNTSRYDNYSTRGNYNPYTSKRGTKQPW